MPIHRFYDFSIVKVSVISLPELLSEKLARYRRASLARNLYDLATCATLPFDQSLLRRMTYMKNLE
jgi:predicted nucleotidyltransferase component of viral defense system